MNVTTLSSKFQISIPKPIRDQLHLHQGQKFVFVVKGRGLYLVPARSIQEIKGMMADANTDNICDYSNRV